MIVYCIMELIATLQNREMNLVCNCRPIYCNYFASFCLVIISNGHKYKIIMEQNVAYKNSPVIRISRRAIEHTYESI